MNIVIEKREIVGTLSTLVGRFPMLDLEPLKYSLPIVLLEMGALRFYVLNDEGFECNVIVRGDFVVIPSVVPTMVDVKVIKEANVTFPVSVE